MIDIDLLSNLFEDQNDDQIIDKLFMISYIISYKIRISYDKIKDSKYI